MQPVRAGRSADGAFIAEFLGVSVDEAKRVQKDFYDRYGTTVAGLTREHKLPAERFLDFVHDIDLAPVCEAPALGAALERLPGGNSFLNDRARMPSGSRPSPACCIISSCYEPRRGDFD